MQETGFVTVVIFVGSILSLTHYFSYKISSFLEKHHYRGMNLSGGTLIAIIFLVLLPEVTVFSADVPIYFLMLLGFSIFYIGEKYLYQHVKNNLGIRESVN